MHYLLLRHRKISAFASSTTDQHAGDLFQKAALSLLRKYNLALLQNDIAFLELGHQIKLRVNITNIFNPIYR